MKKSIWKQKLHQAITEVFVYEHICYARTSELQEMNKALQHCRQLCKTMEELVNREQPKSMEEMAIALRQHEMEIAEELWILSPCRYKDLSWKDLPQDARDGFYDALLKIIG